jgi:hypothetical protein
MGREAVAGFRIDVHGMKKPVPGNRYGLFGAYPFNNLSIASVPLWIHSGERPRTVTAIT